MIVPCRLSLLLGACAFAAGTVSPQAAAQTVPGPPPIVFRPFPRVPPAPPPPPREVDGTRPARPLSPRLEVISAPDWSDPDIYPAASLRLGQEGAVRFDLVVGPNGRPLTCLIVESSGFTELDAGTCRLATTMRFAPPGQRHIVRTRIVWVLAPDPMPFVPHRMVATLDLVNGEVANCSLAGSGPLFDFWSRFACRTFGLEVDYYLGPRRWSSRRATIVVDLVPERIAAPLPPAGRGTQTAVRRTAFAVDANGDPGGCRTLTDRGFGRPRIDHADACGFFLARGFEFEEAADPEAQRSGVVEVRVLMEPAARGSSRR